MNLAITKQPKSYTTSQKIYIREADGTSYEANFTESKKLLQILSSIYDEEMPIDPVLICKGRLLDIQRNLQENNIKPHSVIHLRKKTANPQQRAQSYVFISFKDKLHKIEFDENETVLNLKLRVEKETEVPSDKQIILYNGFFLEEGKNLKDYEVKNQQVMNMGEVENNKYKELSLFPEIIFPMKVTHRDRRGSAGQFKATGSAFEAEEIKPFFKTTNSTITVPLNKETNKGTVSPTLLFGPGSSQISEQQDVNFNLQMGKWVQAKSQSANSPLPFQPNMKDSDFNGFGKNIFGTKGGFQVQTLQFNDGNKDDDHKINLEAFKDLLEPIQKQIVFCQSYYEKGDDEEEGQQNETTKQTKQQQPKQTEQQPNKETKPMVKRQSIEQPLPSTPTKTDKSPKSEQP